MDSPGSRSLFEAAAAGDRRAQDRIVEEYLPTLRAFVRLQMPARLRAKESVSDCVQTVFREAFGDLEHFEWKGTQSFRNWLFAFARNKLGNRIQFYMAQKRDPAREVPLAPDDSSLFELYASVCSPSQAAIQNEDLGRLEEAMDELPPDLHEALLVTKILGMSYREAADELALSESVVRSLVNRAIVRLSVLLQSG
jgi:RNA polymerase sigma-70 factor (ECF subfamily)